jgi:hypothetical protein
MRALLPLALALGACAAPAGGGPDLADPLAGPVTPPDPAAAPVPLEAAADGWEASLLLDVGSTGIWTVKSFQVLDTLGQREVVGLDDRGRCWVLVGYSGNWTPLRRIDDGRWLGGLAHGDVDPRVAGAELYTGGQAGNLYQLTAHHHGALDARLVAHFPGEELHTIVVGDVDAETPGVELLVFTRPGALYRVSPTGEHGAFEVARVAELEGRVRDAVVLPDGEVATVSRAGTLETLRLEGTTLQRTVHARYDVGLGRLALGEGPGVVLYATLDDGRITRHERTADGRFTRELIHIDEQGPRGIAAGRFHADPGVESVAIFGYGKEVRLLSRRGDEPWAVETLFVDRDKGHWLSACEVDGRNGTRELVGSGYGGRIFLLSRPAGHGLELSRASAPAGCR